MINSKKLILFQFLGENKKFFYESGADDRNQFIQYLRYDLKMKGFITEPLKNQKLEDIYAIFFFDMNSVFPIYAGLLKKIKFIIINFLRSDTSSRNIFYESKKKNLTFKKYLIAFEPKLICPDNYKKKYADLFNRTFCWSENCCGGKSKNTLIKLPIPEGKYIDIDPNSTTFSKKKLLFSVSSNKGYYKKESLCRFKYKGYEELYKILKNDFDLYGYFWNQSLFRWFLKFIRGTKSKFFFKLPQYFKGIVENKNEIMDNYKFCLIIENMSEISFITEKIFHAIYNGCIPIYYGAPNISKIIPKGCFINLRDFKGWESLCDYIMKYKDEDYKKFLIKRKSFLHSKEYKDFTSSAFVEKISSNIFKEIEISKDSNFK